MTNWKDLKPINDFTLRPILPGDSQRLRTFELACSALDGETNLSSPEEWDTLVNEGDLDTRSVVLINNLDEIAYVGWFNVDERVEEILVFLDGRVHPNFRGQGYGTGLMDWLESTAKERVTDLVDGKPPTYRIMYYDRAADAQKLFEKRGFKILYVEQEMGRDLRKTKPENKLKDLGFKPWTAERKSEFYSVYKAAFQTRTDSLMGAEAWHQHFANPESEDFQPGLSLLGYKSGIPVAYGVIHSEDNINDKRDKIGWITQIGVHPDYRRQGIGASLLSESFNQLFQAGFHFIKLSVNVNNPEAISLYKRLGFQLEKSFTMYHRLF